MNRTARSTSGVAFGVAAYGFWGIAPLYWRYLSHVPALELIAHRAVWACVFFWVWMAIRGHLGGLRAALGDRKLIARLALAAVVLAGNWFTFVYGVVTERVLDVSLGYFMNPLLSVALGRAVLGERLRRLQATAVAIAAFGIGFAVWRAGGVSWISLALATCFAVYGLIRKQLEVEPVVGSTVEASVLAPLGLAYMVWLAERGSGHLDPDDLATMGLLVAGGLITALPLLWFVNAARRLRLATLGFLQYLAPSLQFGLAVFVLDEPLLPAKLMAFALVWVALGVFTYDAWMNRPRMAGRE